MKPASSFTLSRGRSTCGEPAACRAVPRACSKLISVQCSANLWLCLWLGWSRGCCVYVAAPHCCMARLPPCSEYARALALVASKAPRPAWTTFFCRCANEAYLEEATFHAVRRGDQDAGCWMTSRLGCCPPFAIQSTA